MSRYPELLVKPLHGEPFHVSLDKDIISIGRSKRNDLVLADQWLSRHHAEIRSTSGIFLIADLESRNGTYVNGQRIDGQINLKNTDVITLGDQQIKFLDEASGSVILTETPDGLDLEGTVVVPTAQLLAAARAQEDTWDNMGGSDRGPAIKPNAADVPVRIKKQNQMLTALSDASMALISNRPVAELLEFILELAFKVIKAERGVLMIDDGGELMPKAVRTESGNEPREEISFSRTIADKVVAEKVSILTNNALSDPRFRSQDSIVSLGIRSAMCVPLWNNEAVTGLIYVDSLRRENSFSQDDLTLLTSLANVAAVKLENAHLLEAMIEKKRMEREFELARDIQQGLLPGKAPDIEGWDLVGTNTPCYTIGGDYFDFIKRSEDTLAVALGDVSGKGAGAALLTMVLRATLHFASQREKTVADIISQTNGVIYDNSPQQFYATFFLTDVVTATGKMRYVNAGHIPPILYQKSTDSILRLEEGGTVLGLFDIAPFTEGEAELLPGDILVIFTDGISEAWGDDEEEFGEDRLAELVRDNATLGATELEKLIQQEVDTYTDGAPPTDDKTIIVVKRT